MPHAKPCVTQGPLSASSHPQAKDETSEKAADAGDPLQRVEDERIERDTVSERDDAGICNGYCDISIFPEEVIPVYLPPLGDMQRVL